MKVWVIILSVAAVLMAFPADSYPKAGECAGVHSEMSDVARKRDENVIFTSDAAAKIDCRKPWKDQLSTFGEITIGDWLVKYVDTDNVSAISELTNNNERVLRADISQSTSEEPTFEFDAADLSLGGYSQSLRAICSLVIELESDAKGRLTLHTGVELTTEELCRVAALAYAVNYLYLEKVQDGYLASTSAYKEVVPDYVVRKIVLERTKELVNAFQCKDGSMGCWRKEIFATLCNGRPAIPVDRRGALSPFMTIYTDGPGEPFLGLYICDEGRAGTFED